ncbi:hypothetical protein [Parachlamydia sp. AcF125]|uniref:hypothetical protein n=1 Tax=Parachlamydia sp. AcF125 TaxID=2795736 RepID=UPI001BC95962|nr:hypothetical protein [Parachlamydia sp. AcF125]MBS4167951.1 hypothetical protein [Parachlamydia sp. AcF125]
MSIIKATSHLVTNHENWHLEYHDKPAVTLAQVVKRCFLSVFIVSPLFLAVSPFLLPLGITVFCQAKKRQKRTMAILEDPTRLESYKKARLEKYKNKIAIFEKKALPFLEKNSLGSLVNLPTYFREWDEDKKRVYWNKFSQINFYQGSLSQKRLKGEFERLEKIRKKMAALEQQNPILSGSDSNEAIQKILELKAVKNNFKVIQAKQELKSYIFCMLPLGFLMDPKGKDRPLFEKKKELLPQLPLFDQYADLVEAHNQLIERHEYLVPLLAKPFKPQV